MIVPLALLIAVWGGPNRARATIRFVIYTLVGSLLMLVGMITLGLRAGSFDLAGIGTSDSRWLFLAFMAAFAIKAPLYPFHGWVPGRLPRGAARGRRRCSRASSPRPARTACCASRCRSSRARRTTCAAGSWRSR